MGVTASIIRRPLSSPRMGTGKVMFMWLIVSLVAFPGAGYLGGKIGGRVDGVVSASIGGAVTGAGIGFVQWLFLRRDLRLGPAWIVATCLSFAGGLALGALLVDYGTASTDLVAMGSITGAAVGTAQAFLLRNRFSLWLAWAVAMPGLFALGWFVTEAIGVDVAGQFTVFGAAGAVAFGILSGFLLGVGRRTHHRDAL